MCLSEGGAACSRRGEPLGKKKRADTDKESMVAGYLGGNADRAAEDSADESDECDGKVVSVDMSTAR